MNIPIWSHNWLVAIPITKIPMTGGFSNEAMQTSTMGLALQSKEELPGMQSPLVWSRVDTKAAMVSLVGNW